MLTHAANDGEAAAPARKGGRPTGLRVAGRRAMAARTSALAALADPTRRAVLERLVDRPCSVTLLAEGFAVTRGAISQHLKVLLDADLVAYRKHGPLNIYSVNPGPLAALQAYVDGLCREARWTAESLVEKTARFELA